MLERDRPADTAAQHPGTPQALHVHGLLAGCTCLPGQEAPGKMHSLVVDPDVTEMITMFQVKGR